MPSRLNCGHRSEIRRRDGALGQSPLLREWARADFLMERRGFEMMAIGAFGASKSMVIRQGLLT
jgi:hypothetical protein